MEANRQQEELLCISVLQYLGLTFLTLWSKEPSKLLFSVEKKKNTVLVSVK